MSRHFCARNARPLKGSILSTLILLVVTSTSFGQSPNDIVKIEEFWELKVDNPDPGYVAPQITNSFAPVKQGDVLYATLSMNHHLDGDDFAAGGLELQLWHGELLLGKKTSDKTGLLATPGETITWKQVIHVNDSGVITFSICNGISESWGTFGVGNNLALGIQTTLTSLNDYHVTDSVNHSGVTFAANRVCYLRLTKVRTTYRSGSTTTTYLN